MATRMEVSAAPVIGLEQDGAFILNNPADGTAGYSRRQNSSAGVMAEKGCEHTLAALRGGRRGAKSQHRGQLLENRMARKWVHSSCIQTEDNLLTSKTQGDCA